MAAKPKLGCVGTGFIVRGALEVIERTVEIDVSRILTRRPLDTVPHFDPAKLTHSIDQLIDDSDVIFESTGDPIHATVVVERALAAGKPVVTMDSELHVTTGSYFHDRGFLSEAEGDQPGATVLMHHDALGMGFEPLAYVNIKGFLNLNPTREEMEYWAERQKLNVVEVLSFTDGTKLQIEQAFVANALDADIAQDGLIGGDSADIFDTDHLVDAARALGRPISDYVVARGAPPGVFVLAEHPVHERLPHYGPYQKLRTKGDKAYVLLRAYHLCALEVAKSVKKVVEGDRTPLLTNGPTPRISCASIAKHEMAPGDEIERGIGSFDVRGSCVRTAEHLDHVPIGLIAGSRVRRKVEPGQTLTFDDLEVPESRAHEIWRELTDRVRRESAA